MRQHHCDQARIVHRFAICFVRVHKTPPMGVGLGRIGKHGKEALNYLSLSVRIRATEAKAIDLGRPRGQGLKFDQVFAQ